MKKYQRPETIDISDLLNEIEQQTSPESVICVKQHLAKSTKSLNYSYQISISQEDNDWNDPLNDHWDNH